MTWRQDSASAAGDDPLDPHALPPAAALGMFEHLAVTGSTMERARELASAPGTPLPALVVADVQTMGRGRRGARWWQADGSLAASLVVESTQSVPPPTWSLACGVALAESVEAVEPTVAATVRWPNDVEVAGRKLAGILVETAPFGRAVFGIGVNTTGASRDAPPPLDARIVTMPDLTGRSLPRQRLLAEFLPRFLRLLDAMKADPRAFVPRYRLRCSLTGHAVTVHQECPSETPGASRESRRITGICRGIAEDGGLLLDTVAGPVHVVSGSLTDPADVWRGT
ncbi:MAG: biotin--[acetyl-CoA-carboxylase] ligase [Planctomycetia bacterium]